MSVLNDPPGVGGWLVFAGKVVQERDEARDALYRVADRMRCQPDDDDDLVEAVRLLVQERDALHRLPVIRTCEDCSHAYPSSEHWACGHPYSPGAGDEIVRIDAAPPTDCPLRGAR